MKILNAITIFCCVTQMGCTVVPTVEYSKIFSAKDLKGDEIDTFFLSKSIIKIDQQGTIKNAEGKDVSNLTVVSIPTESIDFKVGIRKSDPIGVETNLNIAKIENTELIKESGTEVTDRRVEMIEKVGTIITGVAAMAFDASKGLEPGMLPKEIKTSLVMSSNQVGREGKQDVDASEGVTIDFSPIPPDAKAIEDFSGPMEMSGLIYSACRNATIKFTYLGHKYKKNLKISDPRFFQQVAFPVKGKISFHSECGVSVTSEKDTGIKTDAEIINALVAQGKSIKDAIDASKKSATDTVKK
ncbi:hypothetical protein PL263_07950 [Methylomonas sp. EFPC3]|uniref:hypothetical protein n=1 Tax=Methylomonas sp. EFPC3 TaxID=3021710 RepID=UPI0024169391|nr:hypothetical protein [Methylomonas sp. EFPC3]WFP51955.1 hypothetical protein PL263_07950 [Methylomonas sp. EFPC3]